MALSARGRHWATDRLVEVAWTDGVITSVKDLGEASNDEPLLLPAMVDLQVNGYAGHDANEPGGDIRGVASLAQSLARSGTGTFVPTLITASEQHLTERLQCIAAARRGDTELARRIPYVHIEGPFISPEDGPRGAHPEEWVRPPSVAELDRWQDASSGLVGMVTLSPHWPGAPEWITYASSRGVRVAIGHTHATAEQVVAAVDAGAGYSTHLGNGAHAMLPRHPNHIWAQLADDRLTAGLIADGFHLPKDTFVAMLRAKGAERAFLVSDTAALAGMPPGRYSSIVGGEVELTAEGRLGMVGTPYLAGAARSLLECVGVAYARFGLPLETAVRLGTLTPARIAATAGGRLDAGHPADLVVVTFEGERPTIQHAIVGGNEFL